MTDSAEHGERASRIAVKFLVAAILVVAANVLARLVALPHIDLPSISLPDLPGWLAFLLGPGKYIILAVILVLAVVGESERRRSSDEAGDGS